MIQIRGVEIGSGIPKICVPITGKVEKDILEQAQRIAGLDIDIVEWRVDYTEYCTNHDKVQEILKELRSILKEKLILFTFRTQKEGGESALSIEEYFSLNEIAAGTGIADLIDIELFTNTENLKEEVARLQEAGCKVIISNHEFHKTPEENSIVERLAMMEQAGGDILKMAVMPETPQDVLTLLSATYKASQKCKQPVVTMSMSKLGVVSRLAGEIFGSAITFGSAGEASAPGQIPAEQLKSYLQIFS